jgi:hypothetical protein
MEPIIFEPQLGGLDTNFWAGVLIGVASLGATLYLLFSKNPKITSAHRQLGSLLAFIVFLLAMGTTIFSAWASIKIQPVEITDRSVTTPYGEVGLDAIRQAYIEPRYERSLINPNVATDTMFFLIIEERSGKGHVLSEENYEIRAILKVLQERVK